MSDIVLWLNFHIFDSFCSYLEKTRYEEKAEKYAKSTLLCVAASHTGKVTPTQAAAPGRSLALHNQATAYLSINLVCKANISHFLFLSLTYRI